MINRLETCVSDGISYLLAIEINTIKALKEWLIVYGYRNDYLLLMDVFENSFRRKQRRRMIYKLY